MALVVIPQTEAFALTDATPSPLDRVFTVTAQSQQGAGLVRPFRRDEKNDFSNTDGVELVKACVGQILGMRGAAAENPDEQGELEWAPERGSLLHRLRHQRNTTVLQELGRVYVTTALRRWEPRVRVKGVSVTRAASDNGPDTVLVIRVVYDVLTTNQSSNQVLYSNVDQTFSYSQAA